MSTSTLTAPLTRKIDQAILVIEEALDAYAPDSIWVAWSGGKDSTLVLKLITDVCQSRRSPVPDAIDIDQGDAFDEVIAFQRKIIADWSVHTLFLRNDDVLQQIKNVGDTIKVAALDQENRAALAEIGCTDGELPWIPDSPVCNHLLKTLPIRSGILAYHVQALFTGIRWDEHSARGKETFFSERTSPKHTRVNPILHFTERDVWDATFALNIPHCSLYRQGYRSLGTRHGTTRLSSIPAWEQDLEATTERGGRSNEKEAMMDQLRKWGYM